MDLLTVGQVSRELGVSAETIREYARRGILPAMRNYLGWRLFKTQDVERLKREREKLHSDNGPHQAAPVAATTEGQS